MVEIKDNTGKVYVNQKKKTWGFTAIKKVSILIQAQFIRMDDYIPSNKNHKLNHD